MKKLLLLTLMFVAAAGFAAGDDGMDAARKALFGPAKNAEKTAPLRDTKITAKTMEYNYKQSVAVMTGDVVVDDVRFRLTSDRIFVFLDGTNSFSQLVVTGNVKVTNESRRAACDKAVFTKKENRLVMVGHATLSNIGEDGKTNTVSGDKITIWTDDQRMEVYPNPVLKLAPGTSGNLKDVLK